VNRFAKQSHVHVIYTDKNIGFARGNNIGFAYAKNHLKADFIVLLNNDTLINQTNFCNVILKKYEEKNFYVLGPDIKTKDGYHQNPLTVQKWSFNQLKLFRLKTRIRLVLLHLHLDKLATKVEKKDFYCKEKIEGDILNTALHGACLIFSPAYIKKFEGLCDRTFLYMEEDVLKLFADYHGFLMMYTGDISICHKEDIATNMVKQTAFKKRKEKYKRLIASSIVYEKLKREMMQKKTIKK
jgi:GT2 family glycosyltransferase